MLQKYMFVKVLKEWLKFTPQCPLRRRECWKMCESFIYQMQFVDVEKRWILILIILIKGRVPLGWVHTCNVTAYRNTVWWHCGRDLWPRNVSKVGYSVTLRACSVCCRYLACRVDVQRHVARLHLLRP